MSHSLSFTGERFLPECSGEIWYEHWHRYALARQLCRDCSVLDVACGEGYGAAMVADVARKVVGVDVSVEAIQHAKNQYNQLSKLEFIVASCESLPFPDASFDFAISFETIEHIEKQKEFISELARVLRPDGMLVLSSPNKRIYSDAHDYHNEFHVRELYRNELEELLHEPFPYIFWLGQKLLFHSAIWPENQSCSSAEYWVSESRKITLASQLSVEPMYYIAVCSRNVSALPDRYDKLSLFSDDAEMVYQDYVRQTRRVIQLDQLLKDRDSFLLLRTQQMEEREKLIAERDALLDLRTKQLNECSDEINRLNTLLELRNEQVARHESLNDALNQQNDALNQQLVYRASLTWWLKSPLRFILRAIKGNS